MYTLFIGIQEIFLLFFFGIAGLAPLIFMIIALVDLFKREFGEKTTDKILLIVVILCAPIVGSIIYYFALRNSYPLKPRTY